MADTSPALPRPSGWGIACRQSRRANLYRCMAKELVNAARAGGAQSWVRGGAPLRVCCASPPATGRCAGDGVIGATAGAGPEPSLSEPIIGAVNTVLSLT